MSHRLVIAIFLVMLAAMNVMPAVAQSDCPPPKLSPLSRAEIGAIQFHATPAGEVTSEVMTIWWTQILEGPICAGGLSWWWGNMQDRVGWIAEAGPVPIRAEANDPITPENAVDLTLIKSLGFGGVQNLAWAGDDLLIDGTTGKYRYQNGLLLDLPETYPIEGIPPEATGAGESGVRQFRSPDGTYLSSIIENRVLVSRGNEVVSEVALPENDMQWLFEVQYFPTLNLLSTVFGCFAECGLSYPGLSLWSTLDGSHVRTLEPGGAWRLALNDDGTQLAAGSMGGELKIWDTTTWEADRLFAGNGYIKDVVFVGDGICYTDGSQIYTWHADCRQATFEDDRISADGTLTVIFGDAGSLKVTTVIDSATGDEIATFPEYEAGFGAAFSPDGKWLVITPVNNGYQFTTATYLTIWNTETRQVERTVPMDNVGWNVIDAEFSPDGDLLVTTGYQSGLVWDTSTWTIVATLDDYSEEDINTAAFSPDGTLLALGGGFAFEATSTQSVVRLYAIR